MGKGPPCQQSAAREGWQAVAPRGLLLLTSNGQGTGGVVLGGAAVHCVRPRIDTRLGPRGVVASEDAHTSFGCCHHLLGVDPGSCTQ